MEATGKRWIAYGKRGTEFRIWNLSDYHWGARACAESHVRADIEEIENDPFSFWFSTGDYADYIGYTDSRFDPDAVAERYTIADLKRLGAKATREVRDLWLPIKDKCMGIGFGNHEAKWATVQQQADRHAWLCEELGVPNLRYSGFMDLVFARKGGIRAPALLWSSPGLKATTQTFRIYYHHGAGYAQTKGGKINRLERFMKANDADMYYTGHVHERIGTRTVQLGADARCTKICHRERLGMVSGAYLKTYAQGQTTYGEQKGYDPVVLGAAWIRVDPEKRRLAAEI